MDTLLNAFIHCIWYNVCLVSTCATNDVEQSMGDIGEWMPEIAGQLTIRPLLSKKKQLVVGAKHCPIHGLCSTPSPTTNYRNWRFRAPPVARHPAPAPRGNSPTRTGSSPPAAIREESSGKSAHVKRLVESICNMWGTCVGIKEHIYITDVYNKQVSNTQCCFTFCRGSYYSIQSTVVITLC